MNPLSAAPVSASTRWIATLVLAVTAAVLLVGPGHAQAKTTVSGKATFTLGTGKAGKALKRQKVRITRVAPARVKRLAGKRFRVVAPVSGVSTKPARTRLKGGFSFRRGKRSIAAHGLVVNASKKAIVVVGRLGGKKIRIFRGAGRLATTTGNTSTLRLRNGKLRLTPAASRNIRKRLKVKRAPAAAYGKLVINAKKTSPAPVDPCVVDPNAEGCQPPLPEDPYLAQCGVAATSQLAGTLTPAPAAPEFTSIPGVTGPSTISWGFKGSYRTYVTSIAGGSMYGLDGATHDATNDGAGPGVPRAGFDFPTTATRYSDNGTPADLTDDKAVVEGTGTALFCATGHEFRVALSNPTIVIDGNSSRLDADVDANLSGTWIPTQRITVATLDIGQVTQKNQDAPGTGSTIAWSDVPASLTAEGSAAFCGTGDLDKCSGIYPAGTDLDPISIEVTLPDPISEVDPYASSSAPELADCNVQAKGITSGRWAPAAPLPVLEDAKPTTAPSSVSWGLRAQFRSYVYGSNAAPPPPKNVLIALDGATREAGDDPTRGFSYPVSGGQYAANDPVNLTDDQAIINGTGTALYCNNAHGFWGSVSNPTIVIDGENSRIVADVRANESGVLSNAQRVTLADLDVSAITPTSAGSEVTWSEIPATLSEEAGPFVSLNAGTELDPVSITVDTE